MVHWWVLCPIIASLIGMNPNNREGIVYKLPSKDPRKSLLVLYRFAKQKHVKEEALVHFGHDVYMIICTAIMWTSEKATWSFTWLAQEQTSKRGSKCSDN